MNCRSSEARFEPFLDGELVPRERVELIAHVEACAACRSLLEELRVVDALLLEPRDVQLAPNFTFATMAEVRALPAPRVDRSPMAAYIVSYLVAVWLIVAAAFVLSPNVVHLLGAMLFDIASSIANALGGLTHVLARSLGRDGNALPAVVSGLLVLDITLALAFGAALAYVRPRLAERFRS
ncbi:MAG: hypothetical protein NVSMB64_06060 [Candidatus Velthaea sp.]